MTVYYNEFDPFAAAWLRELIKAGHIADGVVDERSIEDVCPSDLRGFTQCHFFAGIGVWSYALRRAGWSDDRPVWTGSCPCQPFSAAGKGAAFADERHLWPAFFHLIQECKPAVVFGEQVASKDANPWIDLVQTDLEAVGYGVGAVAFPAAGVGAPHIRDRLYWVADAEGAGKLGVIRDAGGESAVELRSQQERVKYDCGGWLGGVGHTDFEGLEGLGRRHQAASGRVGATGPVAPAGEPLRMADASDERQHRRRAGQTRNGRYAARVELERLCDAGRVADAASARLEEQVLLSRHGAIELQEGVLPERWAIQDTRSTGMPSPTNGFWRDADWLADAQHDGRSGPQGNTPQQNSDRSNIWLSDRGHIALEGQPATGPTNGFWRDADWLFCRDGKWRPVEPGTFPLAHGAAARVGRLRGYGNAINAVAAQAFIESVMEAA